MTEERKKKEQILLTTVVFVCVCVTDLYHLYQDATYFKYEIKLMRDDVTPGERYILFVSPLLFVRLFLSFPFPWEFVLISSLGCWLDEETASQFSFFILILFSLFFFSLPGGGTRVHPSIYLSIRFHNPDVEMGFSPAILTCPAPTQFPLPRLG